MSVEEREILVDGTTSPNMLALEQALGAEAFSFYQKFLAELETRELEVEWHFYPTCSKTWLGKLLYKKKNTGWLSIWNTGFKVTVFIPPKALPEFDAEGLGQQAADITREISVSGKSRAVITLIDSEAALQDTLLLLEFRRDFK